MRYGFVVLAAAVLLLFVTAASGQEEPILCGEVPATIVGTEGPDKLTGTPQPELRQLQRRRRERRSRVVRDDLERPVAR